MNRIELAATMAGINKQLSLLAYRFWSATSKIITLIIAIGLCYGCGGDTIAPTTVDKLPAMSLLDDPIADSTRLYQCYRDMSVDPYEYVGVIPSEDLTEVGRVDDIWLRYDTPGGCWDLEVHIWQVIENQWTLVEFARGTGDCHDLGGMSAWLLSLTSNNPQMQYLDNTVIRLKGRLGNPTYRLVRYRDDYDWVTVRTDLYTYGASPYNVSLGFDGRHVWVLTPAPSGDSVFVYNTQGDRVRTLFLVGVRVAGMTWDGERFWLLEAEDPPSLLTLSLDGSLQRQFALPVTSARNVRGGIAWKDSLIWMPLEGGAASPTGMEMMAIDPVTSLASEIGVIVREITAPSTFRYAVGITAVDDELVILTGTEHPTLYRMSGDGIIADDGPVPVSASAITWDGESLWMLHNGPSAATTNGVLLSRFILP